MKKVLAALVSAVVVTSFAGFVFAGPPDPIETKAVAGTPDPIVHRAVNPGPPDPAADKASVARETAPVRASAVSEKTAANKPAKKKAKKARVEKKSETQTGRDAK